MARKANNPAQLSASKKEKIMIDFNRNVTGDSEGPSVRVSFDETSQSTAWNTPQYFVDFLSSIGHDATVVAALQAVIDTNNPPA